MIQLLVCGPLDRGANQDKGLNRDVKVILEEFSLDSTCTEAGWIKLSQVTMAIISG